jgi:hypothetical protein
VLLAWSPARLAAEEEAADEAADPADSAETEETPDSKRWFHGRIADGLVPEQPWWSRAQGNEMGLAFGAEEGAWYANVWLRAQTRFSDPFDSDPLTVAAMQSPPGADLELRRGRLKLEGHLFRPWLGYYLEHELTGDHPLLDLRLDLVARDDLRFRLGQTKVMYTRERVDSSGKQQFVERSIATYTFTVDRQVGATALKHFAQGTRADTWIMLGAFEGDGIDPGQRGDDPMYAARIHWQPLGREFKFSQSDFAFSEQALVSVSLAAARVRGPYTRFSSSGGGQLNGFEAGGDERYTLEQWQQGFAWKYQGWSAQQEYHQKRIEDHEAGRRSELKGGYAQLGKAWPFEFAGETRPLELALRYARVSWENTPLDRAQTEWTVAANWFLSGHNNKFTTDLSWLDVDESGGPQADDVRFRVQWDFSF